MTQDQKTADMLKLQEDTFTYPESAVRARNAAFERLKAENAKLRAALEKIADPRKRDHAEPDAYTTLGCVMNIAVEALQFCDDSEGKKP